MITWILKKRLYQSPKTILHGRDAILRVRSKWLIFNMVSQLWANVKYHVPTGFGFLYYPDFGWPFWVLSLMGVDSVTNQRQTKGTVLLVCICQRQTKRPVPLVCGLCGLLEIRHATSLTTGAKHWHQQKAVFYVFVSVPQYLSTEPKSWHIYKKETRTQRVSVRVWNI